MKNTFEASAALQATFFIMDLSTERLGVLRTFRAFHRFHTLDLGATPSCGGTIRYLRNTVQTLVQRYGKDTLREEAILLPTAQDSASNEIRWMGLAELEQIVAVNDEDEMSPEAKGQSEV